MCDLSFNRLELLCPCPSCDTSLLLVELPSLCCAETPGKPEQVGGFLNCLFRSTFANVELGGPGKVRDSEWFEENWSDAMQGV